MARTGKSGGPVVFERDLLGSTAYLSLTGKAAQVLSLFMCKRKMKKDKTKHRRWVVINNGEIEFTYTEAEDRWGVSRSAFQRALKQLVDKGFIDVEFRGSGVCGSSNRYAISERWRKWDTDDFRPAKELPQHNFRGFKKGHLPYGKKP